jgi:hypothetical protein
MMVLDSPALCSDELAGKGSITDAERLAREAAKLAAATQCPLGPDLDAAHARARAAWEPAGRGAAGGPGRPGRGRAQRRPRVIVAGRALLGELPSGQPAR